MSPPTSARSAPAERIASAGNVAVFAVVGVLYALLSLAAYELFGALTIGVTYFPPAGLTFAALVLLPLRRWPAVGAAIVVAGLAVDLAEGLPFAFALGWALANTAEPVVGAMVTRRLAHTVAFSPRFAVAFLVGGLLMGPAVGAAIGATNLAIEDDHPWLGGWADAWIGDALGVLVVAPLVFVLAGSIRLAREGERRREVWFGVVLLLVLAIAFWSTDDAAVGYIAIPVLVWAALRQGPLGLALISFVMAAVATAATAHDRGPWGSDSGLEPADRLRQQQAFLLAAIGGAWVLALEVRGRVAAVQQARDVRADLELALERASLVDEVRAERDRAAALQAFTASLTGASTVDDVETVVSRHANALVPRAEVQLEIAPSATVHDEEWSPGFAALPVRSSDGELGTLTARFADGEPNEEALRTALRSASQLVGQALERARLNDEERERRLLLLAINEMLAALGGVTTIAGVAAAVERHGREALDADAVALALSGDDGVLVVRAAAGSTSARVGDDVGTAPDDPLPGVVRTGRAAFVDGANGDRGQRSWAALPLNVGGQTVGAVWFSRSEPWSDPLRLRALSFASFVADALGRVRRAQADHQAALALQQTLMPRRTPRVERARVAARYRPATGLVHVGGDWYEVIPTSGRHTFVVIGDVVGHGVTAAGVMGQLSSAVRALSNTTSSPAALVGDLEVMAANTPGAAMSTVVCATFTPTDLTFTYCRAGHPPPVLRAPDGRVELLDHDGGGPLCCGRESRSEATVELAPGSLLVLYTDGLIEWSGSSIEARLDELAATTAAVASTDPAAAADEILDKMAQSGRQADDIALLCLSVDVGTG